jgi:hypothetical protein
VSLTVHNASVPPSSMVTALRWWVIGALLTVAYFVLLSRLRRSKVVVPPGRDGY